MRINWRKEILTLPNFLSLLRLLLIPVYSALYLRGSHGAAGVTVALGCLTDAADGFLARSFHMASRFGALLDPIADKLTQFFLLLWLSLRYPALLPVLAVLAVKELFQLTALGVNLRRGLALKGALPLGKVSTGVLFASLTALVVLPQPAPWLIRAVAGVDLLCLMAALVQYAFAFFGPWRRVEPLAEE